MTRLIIGLVLAIGITVLASIAVILAFFVPVSRETDVHPIVDMVPSDLTATTVHDRLVIELAWTQVEQEDVTLIMQRAVDNANGPWQPLTSLETGSTSYLDENLEEDLTYYYRIRASTPDGGLGHSNIASAVATLLPHPNQ